MPLDHDHYTRAWGISGAFSLGQYYIGKALSDGNCNGLLTAKELQELRAASQLLGELHAKINRTIETGQALASGTQQGLDTFVMGA